jgi:hypothetical protein
MKIKVILTGSTGMVGEVVLHECLRHPNVEKVLVLNRRPCGVSHPKLVEILHDNFFDLSPIEGQLAGYNTCFYCLGVTSLRITEADYFRITYTLTLEIAQRLARLNPGMAFCYVSGAGANTPDKAKFKQARVKGQTETALFNLPFKNVYAFRPGLLFPTKSLKNTHTIYYVLKPFYPIFRMILPGFITTLKELALAMIQTATNGYEAQILEVRDILKLSKK